MQNMAYFELSLQVFSELRYDHHFFQTSFVIYTQKTISFREELKERTSQNSLQSRLPIPFLPYDPQFPKLAFFFGHPVYIREKREEEGESSCQTIQKLKYFLSNCQQILKFRLLKNHQVFAIHSSHYIHFSISWISKFPPTWRKPFPFTLCFLCFYQRKQFTQQLS